MARRVVFMIFLWRNNVSHLCLNITDDTLVGGMVEAVVVFQTKSF